jgi:hypothetical protein
MSHEIVVEIERSVGEEQLKSLLRECGAESVTGKSNALGSDGHTFSFMHPSGRRSDVVAEVEHAQWKVGWRVTFRIVASRSDDSSLWITTFLKLLANRFAAPFVVSFDYTAILARKEATLEFFDGSGLDAWPEADDAM